MAAFSMHAGKLNNSFEQPPVKSTRKYVGSHGLLSFPSRKKKPQLLAQLGFFGIKSLAVTYFHIGKPYTIIGAKQFHFRVRYGIGWVLLAIAAKQTGLNQCHK